MTNFLVGVASGLVGSLGTMAIWGIGLTARIAVVESAQGDLREWLARIETKLDRVILDERQNRRGE